MRAGESLKESSVGFIPEEPKAFTIQESGRVCPPDWNWKLTQKNSREKLQKNRKQPDTTRWGGGWGAGALSPTENADEEMPPSQA